MNEEPIKSPHYVLVIDEKRDSILNVLIQFAVMHKDLFHDSLEALGVSKEESRDFITDMSDKGHALGWCTDPFCKHV